MPDFDLKLERVGGKADHRPLAERVRPARHEDLLGQAAIWSPGAPLRELVDKDRFHALLFWGPPGTGKTSLAQVIGAASGRRLVILSAVLHGVKDIRRVIEESELSQEAGGKASLLFMDEIHRLSKSQQDVLLPALESGTVKFIGATTENPSFEVNRAILSRALVFRFERLTDEALVDILVRALQKDASVGQGLQLEPEVLGALARSADGDARRALNLLDAVAAVAPAGVPVTKSVLQQVAPQLNLQYDKQGDLHYDVISAFIKSIRASQPDAALYYLARMLESGEDPVFVARRIVIAASEDIGNANPTALLIATAAMQAVHMVGMPEARIMLGQATTYLASSPKSNRSYMALNAAMDDVRASGSLDVPLHLRNAPTQLMKEIGYGKGYVYAHDDQAAAMRQNYLPEALKGRRYYEPLESGAEATLKKHLEYLQNKAGASAKDAPAVSGKP